MLLPFSGETGFKLKNTSESILVNETLGQVLPMKRTNLTSKL